MKEKILFARRLPKNQQHQKTRSTTAESHILRYLISSLAEQGIQTPVVHANKN